MLIFVLATLNIFSVAPKPVNGIFNDRNRSTIEGRGAAQLGSINK